MASWHQADHFECRQRDLLRAMRESSSSLSTSGGQFSAAVDKVVGQASRETLSSTSLGALSLRTIPRSAVCGGGPAHNSGSVGRESFAVVDGVNASFGLGRASRTEPHMARWCGRSGPAHCGSNEATFREDWWGLEVKIR